MDDNASLLSLLSHLVGVKLAKALVSANLHTILQSLDCVQPDGFHHPGLLSMCEIGLTNAIAAKDYDNIARLIQKGPKHLRWSTNACGETHVLKAVYSGDPKLVAILGKNGCNCDNPSEHANATPVMHTIQFNKPGCLRALLPYANCNDPAPVDQYSPRGNRLTPLVAACMRGHVECVAILANCRSVDINNYCLGDTCMTALTVAVACDSKSILNFKQNAQHAHSHPDPFDVSFFRTHFPSVVQREACLNALLSAATAQPDINASAGHYLFNYFLCKTASLDGAYDFKTVVVDANGLHQITWKTKDPNPLAAFATLSSLQFHLATAFSKTATFNKKAEGYLYVLARLLVAGASWQHAIQRMQRHHHAEYSGFLARFPMFNNTPRTNNFSSVKDFKQDSGNLPSIVSLMRLPFEAHSYILHKYHHPRLRSAVKTVFQCAHRIQSLCDALPSKRSSSCLPTEMWLHICTFLRSSNFA